MITAALCNSYKVELYQGLHKLGDDYRIALFTASARLGKGTTRYDGSHESSGNGYEPGGQRLAGITARLDGDVAILDWSDDPIWERSSITARGALIYNASRDDRAVAVLDFGVERTSMDGPFELVFPDPIASGALIWIR